MADNARVSFEEQERHRRCLEPEQIRRDVDRSFAQFRPAQRQGNAVLRTMGDLSIVTAPVLTAFVLQAVNMAVRKVTANIAPEMVLRRRVKHGCN